MTPAPPLAPGVVVGGRYRVTGVLATGGMGAVYDAIDERLDRAVALKVILRELVEDPEIVARFEREARAAARLSHPGIVQVTDLGRTDDGLGYLVMERVVGDAARDREPRAPRAPTGCELFRDPPPYVRTARCVELTSTYRAMIESRGGDTSACD